MISVQSIFKFGLLGALMLILAACGGDDDSERVLPTIVTVSASNPVISSNTPEATEAVALAATLPPSWTPELTPESTEEVIAADGTITVTPSSTITSTPSWTPTATITPTLEANAVSSLVEIMKQFTPLPTSFIVIPGGGITPTATILPQITGSFGLFTPTATLGPGVGVGGLNCQSALPGGFAPVATNYPSVMEQIGCPYGTPPTVANYGTASQAFEGGAMMWLGTEFGEIYVMYNDGTFFRIADNYDPNFDSESGGETPPSGFHAPIRGFGKIWRENASVRDQLGWGTTPEIGGNATMLEFATGRMVSSSARGDILIFINGTDSNQGQWIAVPGQY